MKRKLPFLNKLNINFNKKGVFRYFLITYIAVFMVPVIISFIMLTGAVDIAKNEAAEKNLIISQQFKYSAEQILIRIENIRARVIKDKELIALNYESQDITTRERYKLTGDIARLNDCILTENDFIESIYLFRNDKGIAMGSNGLFSLERLYHTSFSGSDLPYGKFYDRLNLAESFYIPYRELNVNGIYEDNILCILPIERDIYATDWTHILMTFSKNRFAGKVVASNKNADILILDKENKIIPLYGKCENLKLDYNLFNTGNKDYTDKKEGAIITCLDSELTDWKYIMIEPRSSYLKSVNRLRGYINLGFMISFLLGLIIVFIFSKRNYEKIKKIADLFGKNDLESDELQYINENVLKSIGARDELIRLKEKTDVDLEETKLKELLRGVKYEALSFEEYQKELNGFFNDQKLRVIALCPENINELYFGKVNITPAKKEEEAIFIIKNTAMEKFGGKSVIIDGIIAIAIDSAMNENELYNRIKSLCSFYKKHFNLTVSAGIGSLQEGANSLKKAYDTALFALSYKFLFGKGSVTDVNSIDIKGESYIYSLETEQKLINCVKSGSFDSAKAIIEEIFKTNFIDSSLSVEMAKCLVFNLEGTVLKTIPKNTEGKYDFDTAFISELLAMDTVFEIKDYMLKIFEKICEHNKLLISDNRGIISAKISEFIIESCLDPQLNVSLIAEHFSLSAAYVSKLFKESTGMSILDFIHTQRLKKAKELLKTGKTVSEVAEITGYNNSNAFIRVFKKYEKITPGQFVKMEG